MEAKLKIVFICGCLEPGRNGVGDYTRRLAGELTRQGNTCVMISLNDKYIESVLSETQWEGETELITHRIPDLMSWTEKMPLMKFLMAELNPAWISLQFVPFSFNSRGLNFGLASKLAAIGKGRKWQIMFHELNVGMEEGSSLKHTIWGIVQQYQIKELLNSLKPVVVHTHVAVYKKILERLGAKVEVLPLFSNIPVNNAKKAAESKYGIAGRKQIDLVIFGGIHHGAPVTEFAADAASFSKAEGIDINLVIMGKNGDAQVQWIEEWKAAGLRVEHLGEQSEEKISSVLGDASFGLFTTPIALVEKSGSVAAMREHRMHLLCVSRAWKPKRVTVENNPFKLEEYVSGGFNKFLNAAPDFSFMPSLNSVAKQFSTNLFNT